MQNLKETDIITTVESPSDGQCLRKMKMFHVPTKTTVWCNIDSTVKYNLYQARIHLRNELYKRVYSSVVE